VLLKGKKTELRALELSDIDTLYHWENNPEIWRVSDTVQPYSRYSLEEYVKSIQDIYTAKQLRLIIEIASPQKQAIGCIDLFDFDALNSRVGLAILIADKNFRNKKFASEALSLVIDYCFSVLFLHQLYCNITVDNEESLKLFQSKKFEIIGIKKDWIKTKNGFADEYVLQLINE